MTINAWLAEHSRELLSSVPSSECNMCPAGSGPMGPLLSSSSLCPAVIISRPQAADIFPQPLPCTTPRGRLPTPGGSTSCAMTCVAFQSALSPPLCIPRWEESLVHIVFQVAAPLEGSILPPQLIPPVPISVPPQQNQRAFLVPSADVPQNFVSSSHKGSWFSYVDNSPDFICSKLCFSTPTPQAPKSYSGEGRKMRGSFQEPTPGMQLGRLRLHLELL